jgi:hypothetical protein
VHCIELHISADHASSSASPAHPNIGAERGVQHHIYQAMLQVTRRFFEQSALLAQGDARLPHLMLELSCLRTKPLPSAQAMRLEARLNIASEEGFSVDYTFWGTQGNSGHELAAWRSLHSFYDHESEQSFVVDSHFSSDPTTALGSENVPPSEQKTPQATTQSYR